jgi:hypothetical protein
LRETRSDDRAVFETVGAGFCRIRLNGRPFRVKSAMVATMGYDGKDKLLAAN